jgi:glycosyltransferase involved in cell wall biosynthesis
VAFSVLMSVYNGEEPDCLAQALESIASQTLQASQVVLVEDGPLSKDLTNVIESFRDYLPIFSLRLPHNVGLGSALNHGLDACTEELIFRADSDDINLSHRFQVQMEFLKGNPEIDVLGGQINCFDVSPESIISSRKVPLEERDIRKFAKFFSPVNHPSVAFRKTAVKSVGGYPNIRTNQDQALWALLLTRGFKLHNLDNVLVLMRLNSKLMDRRFKNRFKNELVMLRFQFDIGFIGIKTLIFMAFLRWSSRLLPKKVFVILYKTVRILLNAFSSRITKKPD